MTGTVGMATSGTVVAASYLLGSVSFAFILVKKLRGVDLRTVGSGNLGATNAGRLLGRRFAIGIYFLDLLKGFAPTAVSRWLLDDPPVLGDAAIPLSLLAGLAAFVGHCYPIWHRFRGGKGVATASGVILALSPPVALAVAAVFAGVLALFRMVSLGSIVAAVALPLLFWSWNGEAAFERPLSWTFVLYAFLSVGVVTLHRKNLRRILRGEEPKIGGHRS